MATAKAQTAPAKSSASTTTKVLRRFALHMKKPSTFGGCANLAQPHVPKMPERKQFVGSRAFIKGSRAYMFWAQQLHHKLPIFFCFERQPLQHPNIANLPRATWALWYFHWVWRPLAVSDASVPRNKVLHCSKEIIVIPDVCSCFVDYTKRGENLTFGCHRVLVFKDLELIRRSRVSANCYLRWMWTFRPLRSHQWR